MASIETFEDIKVWQEAKSLSVDLYRIFKQSKDYGFRDQILRAALSISNNIAEGFERQTNKEFKQFLFIAKGSAGETRSMIYIAKELGYVTDEESALLIEKCFIISRMLSTFIKKL